MIYISVKSIFGGHIKYFSQKHIWRSYKIFHMMFTICNIYELFHYLLGYNVFGPTDINIAIYHVT